MESLVIKAEEYSAKIAQKADEYSRKIAQQEFIVRYRQYRTLILAALLGLFLIASWMGNVMLIEAASQYYNPIYALFFKGLRYGVYVLMAAAVLMNLLARSYRPVPFAIWAVLAGICFLLCRSSELMILFLVVTSMTPLRFKTGLRIYVWIQGAMLLFIPLMAALNLFPDVIMDEERIRYSLGFTWVTSAPVMLVFFACGLLALQRKKTPWTALYMIAVMDVYLYVLTDTRMAFAMVMVFVLVGMLWKLKPQLLLFLRSKSWLYVLLALPFVLAALGLILSMLYSDSSSIMAVLNGALSGRLSNGAEALKTYGVSLLGQKVEWAGQGITFQANARYLFVDCSYLNIMINYGIVFLAAVLAWQSCATIRAWKAGDVLMLVLLALIACFCFIEVRLINPLYNPFILLAGQMLKGRWRDLYAI